MGDELFPEKDGKILTTDIDYVDVWKVMLTTNTNNNKMMYSRSLECAAICFREWKLWKPQERWKVLVCLTSQSSKWRDCYPWPKSHLRLIRCINWESHITRIRFYIWQGVDEITVGLSNLWDKYLSHNISMRNIVDSYLYICRWSSILTLFSLIWLSIVSPKTLL